MQTLNLKDVTKNFSIGKKEDYTVFNNINLDIKQGEFVSIVGPSGCGKSTLLNMIAGLEEVSSGEIVMGDKRIVSPGPDRGVVFQDPALMPWLSVINNVILALKKQIDLEKTDKQSLRQEALSYLRLVHLSKFQDYYPHELSGGMKQRVAIARTLAMNPQILLMDEPFGALDEQTRMVMQEELTRIWQETGKTVMFVTHNIREAVYLSDRVLLMGIDPGRIIANFSVNISRPRKSTDPECVELEHQIMNQLSSEINKVVKGETG